MERKLKLETWNANGLTKYSLEVKTFILSHDIDILLVSETHFTNKTPFYLQISGYTLNHTMHSNGKAHGGTAIIIRSSIKHYEINKSKRFLAGHKCYDGNMEWLHYYLRNILTTQTRVVHVIKSEKYIKFLKNLGNRFIAAGDYNAKHTPWG